jgi:hypothetical protein
MFPDGDENFTGLSSACAVAGRKVPAANARVAAPMAVAGFAVIFMRQVHTGSTATDPKNG